MLTIGGAFKSFNYWYWPHLMRSKGYTKQAWRQEAQLVNCCWPNLLFALISRPSRPCPYSVEQMYSASPGFRSRSTSTLSDYTGAIDRFVLLRDRSPARQPNTLSSNFADRLTACHPWSQGESDVGLSRYTLVKRGQPPRYRQLPRRLPRIFIWIC